MALSGWKSLDVISDSVSYVCWYLVRIRGFPSFVFNIFFKMPNFSLQSCCLNAMQEKECFFAHLYRRGSIWNGIFIRMSSRVTSFLPQTTLLNTCSLHAAPEIYILF